MNNIPDWAEFTFITNARKYFGGPKGYLAVGADPAYHRQPWRPETYEHWKHDSRAEIIVRKLEND